jgi:hypothetical protein
MSTRLATLGLLLVAAVVVGSAGRAQQCPAPCTASFGVIFTSGAPLPGDTILLTPTSTIQGNGALLGTQGGGVVCHPCRVCGTRYVLSWNITSTKDLVYNNCGVLEDDGGSGSEPYGLWANCGQSTDFEIDYGDRSGSGCPGQPEIPNPIYNVIWRNSCTDCQ